jgi:hypothetical protein
MRNNMPLYLFWSGVVICLLQVWLPHYYLTGDGPCHLYNATMLKDHILGEHTAFYKQFYDFSNGVNPNWFSHVLLTALLFIFHGAIAEKILISMYILVFTTGYKKLVEIFTGSKSSYAILTAFLFVFHQLLAKGFYNYTISLSLIFWAGAHWHTFLEKRNFENAALFTLVLGLLFLSHPVGFGIAAIVCMSICAVYFLQKKLYVQATKYLLLLGLFFLPFILMLSAFMENNTMELSGFGFMEWRADALFNHYDFTTHHNMEDIAMRIVTYSLIILFIFLLVYRLVKHFKVIKTDALLLPVLCTICIYFVFPENIGGGLITMRTHIALFMLAVLYISVYLKPLYQKIYSIALFVLFLYLSGVRFYYGQLSSEAATDYVSAAKYIQPGAVILPLSFQHGGETPDRVKILDRNWSFVHAAQYIALEKKPLILLDNYEANTRYFPFLWKWPLNPFAHLASGEGIESQRPFALIREYEQKTGATVNNVVTWCHDPEYDTGHVKVMMDEIRAHYNRVYISASNRTVVYTRKASN